MDRKGYICQHETKAKKYLTNETKICCTICGSLGKTMRKIEGSMVCCDCFKQDKPNTYICALCKNEYEKGWLDEDALQELKENFGDFSKEACEILCDDCYNEIYKGRSII